MGDEYYGGQFDREYNLDDYTKYLKSKEAINTNQNRMQQWAGGPVKQQNKQMKRDVVASNAIGFSAPKDMSSIPSHVSDFRKRVLSGASNIIDPAKRFISALDSAPFMVAPEAVGMIGAAQEAQQRGVNPMVNWLQRMTPVPVVAPTGNGGEVYNYQSGERYTPMY